MFINISNHPSNIWDKKQLEAAKALTNDGLVGDIPFPAVSATATTTDVISSFPSGFHGNRIHPSIRTCRAWL